jgi:uncharacterized protein (TIRG00374 family)
VKKLKIDKKYINIIRNVLAVAITLGLIFYLIFRFKPTEIMAAITKIEIWPIVIAISIMLSLFILKILRWHYILHTLDIKINILKTTELVLIGAFGASITPAKVGDVVRAYYLSKWNGTKETTSFFSAILDRIVDLICIGFFTLLAIPFFITQLEGLTRWALAAGLVLIFVITMLMFNSQIIRKIVLLLVRIRNRREKSKQETVKENDAVLDNSKPVKIIDDYYSNLTFFKARNYLLLIILTSLFWILLGLQVSVLISSMAETQLTFQTLLTITGIMSIAAIVSLVPISISGIGIRDATITLLVFYSLQIGTEIAFSASLIQTTLNMIIPGVIGGIILLFRRRRKW